MHGLVRALGAGLALLAMPVGAAAKEDYSRQVLSYLEHGLQRHAAAGYAPELTIPDMVEPLRLDHPYLWSVYLRAGVNYRVYGACDIDCSDLDMEIYGADGHFVERDAARDDTPYVQITPARTGRHYVRLWLYACTAEPCHVAARVVSGGAPAPRDEPNAPDR